MPQTGATIELLLGGVWTDITPDVYLRDRIRITRGRPDEGARVDPGSCTLTLNNRLGRYSPRNPVSPLYGLIGRNATIRVSTTGGVRFVGEIAAWPTRWDVSGGDVYVPVQAAGIMRRLGQGAAPLRSAMRRAIAVASPAPLAYWPLEDGAAATQAASGLVGGRPMRLLAGAPQFAATEPPPGSLPLPDFSNGGTLTGAVTAGSASSWTIEAITKFGASLPAGFSAPLSWSALGARATAWELDAFPAGDGGLSIQWANGDFSDFGGPYDSGVGVTDGLWHHIRVSVAQSGTAISVQCWLDGVRVINASEPAVTLGALQNITINQTQEFDIGVPSVGHVAVWSPATTTATYPAATGFDGETAAERISRLCAEEGVPYVTPYGDTGTALVGPQAADTFLTVLAAAADADLGTLYEARDSIALAYRPRASLYNQAAALALDYARRGDVAPPLEPTEDDLLTRNDITMTRLDGSSATATLTDGPLSVTAIGRYTTSQTVSVHADEQLAGIAGWLLHLGTVDEARYPRVTVNLAAAGDRLVGPATTVDVGDRITIDSPPPWLAPGQIDLIVQGYTETIGWADWTITYSCGPGSPWQVAVLDDPVLGRADTDGSELAADAAADDTTISVAVTAGPLWTTDPAEVPFDIRVGGEVMTVTACTGSSSPQTMTVTRAVNSITKSHSAGTDIRLATPMILAL